MDDIFGVDFELLSEKVHDKIEDFTDTLGSWLFAAEASVHQIVQDALDKIQSSYFE